jgi:membrane associated rhomboid family serine protease
MPDITQRSLKIHRVRCYKRYVLVALAIAVLIGAVVGLVTILDPRLRIADEAVVAVLVGVSGAVAGWALLDTVAGFGEEAFDRWDAIGALIGAVALTVLAWRGRRRTVGDLGLTPHSEL